MEKRPSLIGVIGRYSEYIFIAVVEHQRGNQQQERYAEDEKLISPLLVRHPDRAEQSPQKTEQGAKHEEKERKNLKRGMDNNAGCADDDQYDHVNQEQKNITNNERLKKRLPADAFPAAF